MRYRGIPAVALCLLILAAFTGDAPSQNPSLSLEDRIRAQEAIDRVYYSHLVGATLPFEEAIPSNALEEKVRGYLKESLALEEFWGAPVTGPMLEAELARMTRDTHAADRLRELFDVLGNDPVLIQECLVRPALVARMTRQFFETDRRIHTEPVPETEEAINFESDDLTPDESVNRGMAISVRRHFPRLSWDEWWAGVESSLDEETVPNVASPATQVSVPGQNTAAACAPDDTWITTGRFDDMLEPRRYHTAVWTGSHMIVWGGEHGTGLATGDSYDPATDTWTPISNVDAPSGRYLHTAVWTGSQMIVWGGFNGGNVTGTGGRYDPISDTWLPTAPAPVEARARHTAVWTGQEMIIYGGFRQTEQATGTGARYNPVSDTWVDLPLVNNPGARSAHTAVWTGSEMIVWGGATSAGLLKSGGRYKPSTDTWAPVTLTGAPFERVYHVAVWTGQVMIVWGGLGNTDYGTIGGRYNPATDSWQSTTTVNGPLAFFNHAAVWTGSRMLISDRNSAYDPVLDRWSAISGTNRPPFADYESAVWTGDQMIVWGGESSGHYVNVGGRYSPATNTWSSTAIPSFGPAARSGHSAVWTGTQMIIWSGGDNDLFVGYFDGAKYDPALDAWFPITRVGAPPEGSYAAFWTGHYMLLWHGSGVGGRYDPSLDRWLPMNTVGPFRRSSHTAVWTGTKMIVWGGQNSLSAMNTGALYDPEADSWLPTSTVDAPYRRWGHAAVWTGSEMLVWGGTYGTTANDYLNDGGRYNPVSDSWQPIPTSTQAPSLRVYPSAAWTGSEMLVWGGDSPLKYPDPDHYLNTGGRYSPSLNMWRTMSTANAPERRVSNTTIWTGREMVIWGGLSPTDALATGGRYDPQSDTWAPTATLDGPRARSYHTAVWTGSYMAIWGGAVSFLGGPVGNGGLYALGHSSDDDGDGLSECNGDCNDDLETVYPGASQVCDGLNTDCDSPIWPQLPVDEKDDDRDGFRVCGGDCNDSNAAINPTATEACNSIDDNCNGLVDEDPNDADLDIVGDPCDNCRFTANPGQEDSVHPNGVGDACDDPDGDGVFDSVDLCPDDPDALQTDADLDGVGDACDVCPTRANPEQEEVAACIDIGAGSGACLDSSISMRPTEEGVVRVLATRTTVPERIDFQILAASCTSSDEVELLLNDTLLRRTTLPVECNCGPPIHLISITDVEVLRTLWRPDGGNVFQVNKSALPGDTGTFLSWVRVLLDSDPTPKCLFDLDGGDCTDSSICSAGYSGDVLSIEKTVDAPLTVESEYARAFIEDSTLPGSLDISSLSDGPAKLCLETHGDSVLYGATDIGDFLAINPSTGAATVVGTIPVTSSFLSEMEFDEIGSRLYARFFELQQINPDTGSKIGTPVHFNVFVQAVEFVNGRLYAFVSPNLFTVSTQTGEGAVVGTAGPFALRALAYAPEEGVLYGTDQTSSSSTLYRIDPRTGAATVVGATSVPIAGIDFGPDGTLYGGGGGTSSSRGLLYRINRQTGQATLIGNTGFRRPLYLTFAQPLLSDCVPFDKRGEEVLLINDTCNSAPTAAAGSSTIEECTSSAGATVTLDGSASTDADSSAGTNDDIVLFEWFLAPGTPSEELLGTGETLDVALSLGAHAISLRVTDRAGVTAWDNFEVTIADTTPPTILASLQSSTGKPINEGNHQGRSRYQPDEDNDDDGDHNPTRNFVARFSATDTCDAAAVIVGDLQIGECGTVPVVDGQVVRFKQRHGMCEARYKNGILEIKAPSMKLMLTARDVLGNTSSVEAIPQINPRNDEERFNRSLPPIELNPHGPALRGRTP